MRRAGRVLRPGLFHRYDGGRMVPAPVSDADSPPYRPARIVRAGRARRVSGRYHARAADGAVPALGDDAQRHDRIACDDRDDYGAGRGACTSRSCSGSRVSLLLFPDLLTQVAFVADLANLMELRFQPIDVTFFGLQKTLEQLS